jgi:hypothetical protein
MDTAQLEHFDALNEQFALVCAEAQQEGCECPTVVRNGKRIILRGQQIIKGTGAVPCECRCEWDLKRLDQIKDKAVK